MGNAILQLEPQAVWRNFFALTQIPRPSGHEEKIREFVTSFARKLSLECMVDEADNVLIRKPPTPGMEQLKGVVLQAHLDMVAQKNLKKQHDFEREPIETILEAGWVRANGTTLGADNGLGVAAALAVLESREIEHGPLELLLTSNEESGMTGAFGLKAGLLRGDILLNLDSEEEGELIIGCAGGSNATITIPCADEPLPPDNYRGLQISVTGLRGGHSGVDIHLGRANANKIMNRLLYHAHHHCGLRLSSIQGGSLRNAIARESFALAAIPASREQEFLDYLTKECTTIEGELRGVEPTLKIEAHPAPPPESVLEKSAVAKLLNMVYAAPDGVMRMSSDMAGLVETSNNLAMVKSGSGALTLEMLLRSSIESAKDELEVMIRSLADLGGASSVFDGRYPGWKPDRESAILTIMQQLYRQKFAEEPEVKGIHAGLECGIIGARYPEMEMISFGPTICFPHSPDEKLKTLSVGKFWEFLLETLRHIPLKPD